MKHFRKCRQTHTFDKQLMQTQPTKKESEKEEWDGMALASSHVMSSNLAFSFENTKLPAVIKKTQKLGV